MKRLMKYEFKGTYYIYLFIFAIMTIVNLFLFSRIGVWQDYQVSGFIDMICFGGFVAVLIFSIKSYSDELNTDVGYLTFTLPIKNRQVFNCKLMFFAFWTFICGVLTYVFEKIKLNLMAHLYSQGSSGFISSARYMDEGIKISFLLIVAVLIITTILLIYFSITMTKVVLRGRKINNFLAFGIFLGAGVLLIILDILIIKYFPQCYYVGDKSAILANEWNLGLGYTFERTKILFNGRVAKVNIASCIYSLVVMIGIYFGIGYLMDNKINL